MDHKVQICPNLPSIVAPCSLLSCMGRLNISRKIILQDSCPSLWFGNAPLLQSPQTLYSYFINSSFCFFFLYGCFQRCFLSSQQFSFFCYFQYFSIYHSLEIMKQEGFPNLERPQGARLTYSFLVVNFPSPLSIYYRAR